MLLFFTRCEGCYKISVWLSSYFAIAVHWISTKPAHIVWRTNDTGGGRLLTITVNSFYRNMKKPESHYEKVCRGAQGAGSRWEELHTGKFALIPRWASPHACLAGDSVSVSGSHSSDLIRLEVLHIMCVTSARHIMLFTISRPCVDVSTPKWVIPQLRVPARWVILLI